MQVEEYLIKRILELEKELKLAKRELNKVLDDLVRCGISYIYQPGKFRDYELGEDNNV